VSSQQPATYKDIQRLTGLSLATISKFYNGRNVLPNNRAAIEKAAEQLGYRVNTFASSLRRGVSGTIGVLLPSLQNGFHPSVIVEVEKYLRNEGISVIVTSEEGGDVSLVRDTVELLLSRRVDGIIAVPSPSNLAALVAATQSGLPVVMIDWFSPELDADSVSLDNIDAGQVAARHLADHGHRELGIVGGESWISTMQDRFEGFTSTAQSAGMGLRSERIFRVPLTVDDAYAATTRLLALPDRPTALFTCNHDLTVGAVTAINDSGLRLGRDISMVGFDAIELAQALRPKLTTILQPAREIAIEAARMMSERLRNPEATAERAIVRLPGRLVVGGSVADRHD
jgi:LacI family transcriptional regulator